MYSQTDALLGKGDFLACLGILDVDLERMALALELICYIKIQGIVYRHRTTNEEIR